MMDDWQLLQRYLSGDRSAMEQLVARHTDMVYSAGCRLCGRTDADDITQAVFLLLTRRAGRISQRQTIIGWLYQATRLCAANLRKQEGRRRRHQEEAAMQASVIGSARSEEMRADAGEWMEVLERGLERLKEAERAAVLARYMEQKSFEESAIVLGTTAEAVRKRAERGLEKLRSFFAARGHAVTGVTIGSAIAIAAMKAPAATLQQVALIARGSTAAPHIAALASGIRWPLSLASKAVLVAVIAVVMFMGFTAGMVAFRPTTPLAKPVAAIPVAATTTTPASVPSQLPKIQLLAADPAHPTEAEVKAFLKARLDRLSNVTVAYTSTTQYVAPPGGWPKPQPPTDGALFDVNNLVAGPAALTATAPPLLAPNAAGAIVPASHDIVFPSGTVESTKFFSHLNGNLRYERTITRVSREAFFPDWIKQFRSLTTVVHGDVMDRLYFFEDDTIALASTDNAFNYLPEPDIESVLALSTEAPGQRPTDRTNRLLTAADIDDCAVSFPDPDHILVTHQLAAIIGRGGAARGVPSSQAVAALSAAVRSGRPPSRNDPVHEEWTLDRAHDYAPVGYRRVQYEVIETVMSDFREVGGLQIPQKAVARRLLPVSEPSQLWRVDSLSIGECHVQDAANGPDQYVMKWPKGKEPLPPARPNIQPPPELSIGGESMNQLMFGLRNVERVPNNYAGVRILDNNPSPSIPAAKRTPWWLLAHQSFVEVAKKGDIGLLFLGDELAEDWSKDAELWKQFAPLKPANFGLRVDLVENTLWRITNGELAGISPKVIVLLAGSVDAAHAPNPAMRAQLGMGGVIYTPLYGATVMGGPPLHSDTPSNIIDGITAITRLIQDKCPDCRIVLVAIPPQGADPALANTIARRARIQEINAGLQQLDNAKTIRFLDLSKDALRPDGSLSPDDFTDGYIPTTKTYQKWTATLLPLLREMTAAPAAK